mgnify:CR=1 FL=1
MNAIEVLRTKFDLNDTSYLRNMQTACGLEMSNKQFLKAISEIRDVKTVTIPEMYEHEQMPKYAFRYLVQNVLNNPDETVDILYTKSLLDAKHFIDNNEWVFAKSEEEIKLNSDGSPAAKKGDKKVLAKAVYDENKDKNLSRKEWIELLVDRVELTPAGASTYYANLKKGKY